MKKILFFGDSITDMWRYREYPHETLGLGLSYVFTSASELELAYPGQFEVINRGIGGNRITDLYDRLETDVIANKPDYVVILIGTNDVWHGLDNPGGGTKLSRFKSIYAEMLGKIKEALPEVKIILMGSFYLEGSVTKDRMEEFAKIKKYATATKSIAKAFGLPFVSLQKAFDKQEKRCIDNHDWLLVDGIHPTSAGAKVIADAFLKEFKKQYLK